jgi:hypothetical protein
MAGAFGSRWRTGGCSGTLAVEKHWIGDMTRRLFKAKRRKRRQRRGRSRPRPRRERETRGKTDKTLLTSAANTTRLLSGIADNALSRFDLASTDIGPAACDWTSGELCLLLIRHRNHRQHEKRTKSKVGVLSCYVVTPGMASMTRRPGLQFLRYVAAR